MYQPIIPGEVLIDDGPRAPVCLPEKRIHPWQRIAVGMVGYLALVAVDNVSHYQHEILNYHRDGDMIENADGCEPFPSVSLDAENKPIIPLGFSLEEAAGTLEVEDNFSETVSAARNFKTKGLRPIEIAQDLIEINRNKLMSFTSEYSGMDIHLYSNSPNPFPFVDVEAIDTLMHASLDSRVVYDHIGVQAYINCAREQILLSEGGSLLEDEDKNILIADRPGVCWKNGLIQDTPLGILAKDFCDSTGGTFKDIRFSIWPFYEYEQTWMSLMTTRNTENEAHYHTSIMFLHEPQHLFMQYLELPFKNDPNEALADYIEGTVVEQLYPESLPETIKYDKRYFSKKKSNNTFIANVIAMAQSEE